MHRYANRGGNSGVVAFEASAHAIAVEFRGGAVYVYTTASAGRARVARMKALALAGAGLGTFISQHVRDAYEKRLR